MKRTELKRGTSQMKRTGFKKPSSVKKKPKAGTVQYTDLRGAQRQISPSRAKERAWSAFAKFIRTRDPRCCTCGAPTTEAGHYRHNSDKKNQQLGGNMLWYHERNVHGQCPTCNRYHSGRLDVYAIFLQEKYGGDILGELNLLFRTPKKWSVPELLEIEARYKALLEKE